MLEGLLPAAAAVAALPVLALAAFAWPGGAFGQGGAQVFARAAPAVILIKSAAADGDVWGGEQGSGFVISKTGLVLTAKHVVPERTPSPVIVATIEGRPYVLSIVKRSPTKDAALLRIVGAPPELRTLPIRRAVAVVGEPIFVLGYPIGLSDAHMVDGIVSAKPGDDLTTNSAINQGNSGGPVVDAAGCAIGIVYSGIESVGGVPVTGVKFAVPTAGFVDLVSDPVWAENAAPKAAARDGIIRVSDTLSRVQEDHGLSETIRQYHDTIAAKPGFVIDAIERVDKLSMAPRDLTYPSPQIADDRKSMTFDYSLSSGPIYDQRRSWIDMTVYTRQRPAGALPGSSAAVTCP